MKEMFKKMTALFALGMILAACTSKQLKETDTSSINETVINEKQEKIATTKVNWPFYEIIQEDEVKGYLLGTVHVGKPEWYPFPEKIETALNQSDKLILEVATNLEENQADSEFAQEAMFSDQPVTIGMSEKSLERYQEVLESYGMSPEDMSGVSRYGIQTVLMGISLMDTTGEADSDDTGEVEDYGVETQLKKNFKKEVIGLETPAFQNEMFIETYTLPEDINEWVKQLQTKEESMQSSSTGSAMEDYEKGDDDISDYLNNSTEEQQELMVFGRNEEWVKQLPEYLKNKNSSFIAVGNAHLYGDRGVVNLLEKAGYELKQVKFD